MEPLPKVSDASPQFCNGLRNPLFWHRASFQFSQSVLGHLSKCKGLHCNLLDTSSGPLICCTHHILVLVKLRSIYTKCPLRVFHIWPLPIFWQDHNGPTIAIPVISHGGIIHLIYSLLRLGPKCQLLLLSHFF